MTIQSYSMRVFFIFIRLGTRDYWVPESTPESSPIEASVVETTFAL